MERAAEGRWRVKIHVRWVNKYAEVLIEDSSASINTGLLDAQERNELVEELMDAVDMLNWERTHPLRRVDSDG
jgi:hypothetical protein